MKAKMAPGDIRSAVLRIAVLVLAAVSCGMFDRIFDVDEPRLPVPDELADWQPECNATDDLSYYSAVTSYKLTEDGEFCEYELTISNENAQDSIWVMVKRHYVDAYGDADENEWLMPGEVPPLGYTKVQGWVHKYADPDARRPGSHVHERLTGLWDGAPCDQLRSEQAALERFSIEISGLPCSAAAP